MNPLENVVSRFLPDINIPNVTLPEEYKYAVNRINELIDSDPEPGSISEYEIVALAQKVNAYERSLFHSKVYYQ